MSVLRTPPHQHGIPQARRRLLAALLLHVFVPGIPLMALDGPFHLADRIPVQGRPAGLIGASDVSMRALKKANTEEAITVGHAFHITRLDWCYSTDAAWITRIRDQGWTYMGALINQTTDRSTWRYKADGSWYIPS